MFAKSQVSHCVFEKNVIIRRYTKCYISKAIQRSLPSPRPRIAYYIGDIDSPINMSNLPQSLQEASSPGFSFIKFVLSILPSFFISTLLYIRIETLILKNFRYFLTLEYLKLTILQSDS